MLVVLLMTPAKVSLALVSVSVLAPSATAPVAAPARLLMLVLPLPVMSNVPSACTLDDTAMLSPPVRVRFAPALIVVAPW